ncbi:hypothetical protein HZB00_02265, partial [Candidatus Woesearchaeota archaeon]|nr:hypothetical protein [Candidatus Woesearchaeota archaeon]
MNFNKLGNYKSTKFFLLLTLLFFGLLASIFALTNATLETVIAGGNVSINNPSQLKHAYVSTTTGLNINITMQVEDLFTGTVGQGNITNVTFAFVNASPATNTTFVFNNNTYMGGVRSLNNNSIFVPSGAVNFTISQSGLADGLYNVTITIYNVSVAGAYVGLINQTFVMNTTVDNTAPKINGLLFDTVNGTINGSQANGLGGAGTNGIILDNGTAIVLGNVSRLILNISVNDANLGNTRAGAGVGITTPTAGNVTFYLLRDVGHGSEGGSNWTVDNITAAFAGTPVAPYGLSKILNVSQEFTYYVVGSPGDTIAARANNTANNTRYMINMSVKDLAGNVNNTGSRYFIVVLDNIVPKIDFDNSASLGNGTSNRGSFTVNFTLIETNPVNVTVRLFNSSGTINTTTYQLNVRPNATLNIINFSAQTGQLNTNSVYYVNFTALDAVLLQNTTTRTIFWDSSVPSPNVQSDVAFDTMSSGETTTISCSGTDVDPAGRSLRVVIANITDGTAVCSASNTSACTGTYTPSSSGTKTIYCHNEDLAGNTAGTTRTLTVNAAKAGSGGGSSGGGSSGGGSAVYS